MLKKIMLLLLVLVGLQMMPVHHTYAQTAPAPGESLDDSSFMFDLSAVTHEEIDNSGTKQSWIRRGINYFFEKVIGFMAGVIGSLAVLMLALGGFLMITSGGDGPRYEQGKNYAKYSVIGLIVVLSAYIIVTLVQLLIHSIYG